MINLRKYPNVTVEMQHSLASISISARANFWDHPKQSTEAKTIRKFKKEVLSQGMAIQKELCGWCTLPMGQKGRRSVHRDHIAPKFKYPQWTFLTTNIILCCEYCNTRVKGRKDPVEKLSYCYKYTTFRFVHPYFDIPAKHFRFKYRGSKKTVLISGRTIKGRATIKEMKLDDSTMTELRAKEYLYHRDSATLSKNYKRLLDEATGRIIV